VDEQVVCEYVDNLCVDKLCMSKLYVWTRSM